MVQGESLPINTERESMRECIRALEIPMPDKVDSSIRGQISIFNSQVEYLLQRIGTGESISEERILELEERRIELCRAGKD